MYDIFQLPDFKFPKDFVWGASTAGHQIEGDNIHSNNWADEQTWSKDPKGIIVPSGKACNHYNMVDEDIKLIKELELPCYRMSIEWARIEPKENEFSEEAIEHYIYELSELKKNGIKVFLTCVHFTVPQWFQDKGGMEKEENLKYFERFLDKVVPIYAPYVEAWNVLNEFNLGMDFDSPIKKLNAFRFHALGYHTIKKYTSAPVSSAHALVLFDPYRRYDKFDAATAEYMDCCCNEFFFHAVRTGEFVMPFKESVFDESFKDTCDFWAINIYTRTMVDARQPKADGYKYQHKRFDMVSMPFYLDEMFPETLIHQLSRLKDKPVYITENGCSSDNDDWRIVFIALYLNALQEVMKTGVDVKGFIYWSLMDNYEWRSFKPRFGLIDVDFETFKRTIKPSGYFYRDVMRQGGVTQELLRKYIKAHPTSVKF